MQSTEKPNRPSYNNKWNSTMRRYNMLNTVVPCRYVRLPSLILEGRSMLNNVSCPAFVYAQGGYGSAPPPPDNAPPPPPPGEQPPPPPGGSVPPPAPGDTSADAYSAYWCVLVCSFIVSFPVCSSAFALSHASLQILGHSLGTTSIRHSLKNGRQASNNSTVSTMVSRDMVVHRVNQGDLLHRRMEFRHHRRRRRLHSPSPSPDTGVGASMCDNCCNDFLSSLLYFNVYFLCVSGWVAVTR